MWGILRAGLASTALACLLGSVAPAQGWPFIFGPHCGSPGNPPATCTIGDSNLSLTLNNGPSSYSFSTLTSAEAGTFEFEDAGIWKLTLTSQGVDQVLEPSDFGSVHVLTFWNTTFIVWRHQSILPNWVSVVAKIRFRGDEFDFDIWVNNWNSTHALKEVCYPIFKAKPINPDPVVTLFSDILVAPFLGGSVNPDPWTLPSLQFPNPGAPFQLFTIFDRVNNRALFWHTKDRFGYRKDYRVTGRGTSTEFEVVHFPKNNHLPGSDYYSPFPLTISGIQGNWYESAVRYREWALNQCWAQRGPIESSHCFSQKAKDLKLFTLMYPDHLVGFDDFPALAADGLRVKQHVGLADDQMMMLWSDWHAKLFNVELPDFEFARPSVEAGVAMAHAGGMLVVPYAHINLWSRDADKFAEFNVEQYAWTRVDGTVPEILVGPSLNQLIFPHIRINPARFGARLARESVVSDVMNTLANESWDGIYLDTWSGVIPELDYNPNLPFPKGGGPFWMLGQRFEGNAINAIVKGGDPDRLVVSEIPLENVIDKVDLLFYDPFQSGTLQLPVWETIYHGYVLTSNLSGTIPQPNAAQLAFLLPNLSYDYHLGKVIGLSNFFADATPFIDPDPGQNQGIEMLDYVRSLVQLDQQAAKYRIFGTRLKPMASSISRSLETLDYFFSGPPAASTSIWEAADSDVGIIVTNHAVTPQAVTVDVDYDAYDLSGEYDVFLNQGGSRLLLTSVADSFTLPAVVNPCSAQLLELVRKEN